MGLLNVRARIHARLNYETAVFVAIFSTTLIAQVKTESKQQLSTRERDCKYSKVINKD